MAIPCPGCGRPLPSHAPVCPACGLRLTGADAQRLWQVDQQLAALQRERVTLLAGLGGPEVGPRTDVSAPAAPGPAGARRPRARSWTVQQLLLTGGVVLLFVAAIVFVAVAWERIGTVGQVAVLGLVTASGLAGSRALSRRGLLASAEAVAVLTVGLAVLDAASVQEYGLFGSDRLEPPTYWLVALPLVAGVLLVGARLVRRSLVFPIAAVLVLAAWPGALSGALVVEVAGLALIAALAWAAGAAAALVTGRSARRPVLVALAAVSTGWLVLGAQAGIVGVATGSTASDRLVSTAAVVVLLAGLAVVARRTVAVPGVHATATFAAEALAVGAVVAWAHHGGTWTLVTVSALASAAGATAIATSAGARASALRRGAAPALLGLAWIGGLVSLTEPNASWSAAGTWLAATAVAGRWLRGGPRAGVARCSSPTPVPRARWLSRRSRTPARTSSGWR